jgi:hypothetical protein
MGALSDKARKARSLAKESFGGVSYSATRKMATNNAKAAGKKLTYTEETRAAKIMQTRRQNDRDRTMARAEFIAGPKSPRAKRETKANISAAVSGGLTSKTTNANRAKKATTKPNVNPVVKRTTPTATPKAKPKTLNDFLKEGKRPPSKNKKIPSDADVIIKGYNDKKTLSKNKKRK